MALSSFRPSYLYLHQLNPAPWLKSRSWYSIYHVSFIAFCFPCCLILSTLLPTHLAQNILLHASRIVASVDPTKACPAAVTMMPKNSYVLLSHMCLPIYDMKYGLLQNFTYVIWPAHFSGIPLVVLAAARLCPVQLTHDHTGDNLLNYISASISQLIQYNTDSQCDGWCSQIVASCIDSCNSITKVSKTHEFWKLLM
jgi:hypothetical protein